MNRTPAQKIGTERQEIGGAPVVDSDTPGAVKFGDKWCSFDLRKEPERMNLM